MMLNLPEGKTLNEIALDNYLKYKNAKPFPHHCFENFFNEEYLNLVLNEFPDLAKCQDSIYHLGTTEKKSDIDQGGNPEYDRGVD